MKKIWIDGYEANVLQRLGSGQVAFELLKNLEKIDFQNEYTILLPSKQLDDLPKTRDGWRYKILKPKSLWTYFTLPIALYSARKKPDIFYSPTHYIPRFSPVKCVATIFDLSYLHFPSMFDRKDLWKLTNGSKFSIKNSAHLIAISNFSKQDIVKHYKVPRNKVTVAYPGYDREHFYPIKDSEKINDLKKRYKINGDYVIYVGTIQPRKNLKRLIAVFKRIENLKLVIVGKHKGKDKEGWMYEDILLEPKRLGIEDRINFTGFIPVEDLAILVNGATCFILPSLWEGFGITAVDAMATGTPVIVSKTSSLPEIVKNAGLLINPESEDQIEQAIRVLATDKKLRAKKSKQALKQASKFSWKKMAKTVKEILEKT